jgi:glutaredoxin 2
MRLYMFEHCSLCFRARMIAALKGRHLQETVVLDDDSDTMVNLVGKRAQCRFNPMKCCAK